MKRFMIFPILLLLSCQTVQAQNQQKIDSLLNQLNEVIGDSSKIDIQLLLHSEYVNIDTTLAIKYIKDALLISKKIDDKNRICKGYLKLCNYYWKKGNLILAEQALSEVEKLLHSCNDKTIGATFQMESGVVYYKKANYLLATDHFLKALTIYKMLDDYVGVAKCYSNIGNCYWQLENLDKALSYYLEAIDINKSSPDKKSLSKTLGNIGLIYRSKKDYKKALEYYLKSLEINRNNNMKLSEAINLQNIGALYSFQKEYDRALIYFSDAKEKSSAINDKIGVLYADHGMAGVYINTREYKKGISILKKSLSLAKELNVREEIKNIFLDTSEAYEKIGDYYNALDHRKSYEIWKDSLINESHLNKVKELELRYESVQKDQEINSLIKEKEIQKKETLRQTTLKNTIIGGFILTVLLAGLLLNTFRQRIKNQKILSFKNAQITEVNFKQQFSELEMKALRAQMNPHFLFNCMNSINRMILSEDSDNASKYLTKFSKLIRLMLENSEKPKVVLQDELDMLKAYIELEALRFKRKINCAIEVGEAIDKETTLIPSMVLQPFVENAIWHGLLPNKQTGQLSININEKNDTLHCCITDNGVGREASLKLHKQSDFKKKSMGIKITTDRLKLLTKNSVKDIIRIVDLKDTQNNAIGTQVDILIPIS